MEEEIDLRPYVQALRKRWKWLILGGIIGIFIGWFIVVTRPHSYRSEALVAVTNIREVVQFDTRFSTTSENPNRFAYSELALSQELIHALYNQLPADYFNSSQALAGALYAQPNGDGSIIRLAVTTSDPEIAVATANAWAELYIDQVNSIFTDYDEQEVEFFETQLIVAADTLANAENELVNYQSINQTRILSNTLESYSQRQADLLDTHQQINSLIRNTKILREQVAMESDDGANLASDVATFFLQLQTYNGFADLPTILQFDTISPLTLDNRSDQLAQLDALLAALDSQTQQIESDLLALEPLVLEVQQQIGTASMENNRLVRQKFIAEETYTILSRKVEEVKISAADVDQRVRIASKAFLPETAVSSQPLIYMFLGGFSGLVISTAVVLLVAARRPV